LDFKKSATIDRMLANANRFALKEMDDEVRERAQKIIKGDYKGLLPSRYIPALTEPMVPLAMPQLGGDASRFNTLTSLPPTSPTGSADRGPPSNLSCGLSSGRHERSPGLMPQLSGPAVAATPLGRDAVNKSVVYSTTNVAMKPNARNDLRPV